MAYLYCVLVTSVVRIQKSKAETDACKGQVAQLEMRIAVDRKDKDGEMETLATKLLQKTEVSCVLHTTSFIMRHNSK